MSQDLHSVKLEPLSPPWWGKTGHAQTIMGHLIPSPKMKDPGVKLIIPLESEDERVLSTYYPGTIDKVVYLFHGLSGSVDSDYMQRTAIIASGLGFHVILTNHRGCGEGAGLAKGTYHSGRSEDLSRVIGFGKKKLPHCQHIALGFSLSANALLLLSAGVRATAMPDIAIAVNAPIHLDRASVKLSQGLNLIYNIRFMRELGVYIKKNRPDEFYRLERTFDLREFDDVYTAPLGGFKNKEDYYDTCSAKQYLSQIKIPTVILTANDDPFVSSQDYLEMKENLPAHVTLHVEKYGGHMGYLDRSKKRRRWLDYALQTYLTALA